VRQRVIITLAVTNPVAIAAIAVAAVLAVAFLAAFVVLLVVCIYFAVGYYAGRVLLARFQRRSAQLAFADVVRDATSLEMEDVTNLLGWWAMDGSPEQEESAPAAAVEKSSSATEAAMPYGWTTLDLPTQPTPSGILGHDEDGKGEIIETTPVADESPAFPAQAPYALLAPSANRTTAATSKRRPEAGDRAAQLEAAKRLLAGGQSVRAAARRLGLSESTLRGWLRGFATGVNG
jgi:hypothetical protein